MAVLALIGCSKNSFKIGEDQWPIVSSGSVSEKAFKEAIVGYGWKSGIVYEMEGGKVTDRNFFEDRDGGGPVHYYFGENERTAFMSADWYPADGYYIRPYEYRGKESAVYVNGAKSMLIARLDNNSFDAIVMMGVNSYGVASFGFITYHRMSEEELSAMRKKYSSDLDKLRR